MTADEQLALQHCYDAAGMVARELALAIDALAGIDAVPLADVSAVAAAALARCRRAYDAAAWVRERYG